MTIRNNVRRAAAAVTVLGAVTAGILLTGGAASAAPAHGACGAGQVDTTLLPGSPGAGQRYGFVQFTAKAGRTCTLTGPLPIRLAGAYGIAVVLDPPPAGGFVPVTISSGQQANMLLHWTGIEAQYVTPRAVTIGLPGSPITMPWTLGSMDDGPEAHTLNVSAVEPGPAPAD